MWYCGNIKEYQITVKYYKNIQAKIAYLGFPATVLNSALAQCKKKGLKIKKSEELIEIDGFDDWKNQFIENHSKIARDHKHTNEVKAAFQSSMNSYLGIMKHFKTYKIRKRLLFKNLSAWWWNYAYLTVGYVRFIFKN